MLNLFIMELGNKLIGFSHQLIRSDEIVHMYMSFQFLVCESTLDIISNFPKLNSWIIFTGANAILTLNCDGKSYDIANLQGFILNIYFNNAIFCMYMCLNKLVMYPSLHIVFSGAVSLYNYYNGWIKN